MQKFELMTLLLAQEALLENGECERALRVIREVLAEMPRSETKRNFRESSTPSNSKGD